MRYPLLICSIIFIAKINAQNEKNTLYIKYDKSMVINEYYDTLENLHIDLQFTISNEGLNAKPTTYKYWIDNLSLNGDLEFKDIKKEVSKEELQKLKIMSLNDLMQLDTCNLYLLLADSKIYLIKKSKEKHYKYSLGYKSTQRGIEYTITSKN